MKKVKKRVFGNTRKKSPIIRLKKNTHRFIIFGFILFFLLFNFCNLSIITFSRDNGLNLYGSSLKQAVCHNQIYDSHNKYLKVCLTRVNDIDNNLNTGELVIIDYQAFQSDDNYSWIWQIIEIENDNITLKYNDELSYIIVNRVNLKYKIVNNANIFDYYIFAATKVSGYIFSLMISAFIGLFSYLIIFKNKNEFKKSL